MPSFLPALLAVIALLLVPNARAAETQYVIISFDGAFPIEQWKRSRALAHRTGASFTYFLSCAYLLTREHAGLYEPPGMRAGRSNIGFAPSREDVAQRLDEIWSARLEGHEIASHGCGHFDGQDWSGEDWQGEHRAFASILAGSWRINGIPLEPAGWQGFADKEIIGFRAPYLSTGKGLFESLAAAGFAYDASTVSRGPAKPEERSGLHRFALPLIPEGPNGRPVIAMDYNLYVRHSGGAEQPESAAEFAERTQRAFMDALQRERQGDRAPLQLGFHFTLMNGGAYWDALERFAIEACALPDVRCVSYRDYLRQTGKLSLDG